MSMLERRVLKCLIQSSSQRTNGFVKLDLWCHSIDPKLGYSVASLDRSLDHSLDRSLECSLGRSVARSHARSLLATNNLKNHDCQFLEVPEGAKKQQPHLDGFEHHVDIIWTSYGQHLDIIWTSGRHHLGIIWTSF